MTGQAGHGRPEYRLTSPKVIRRLLAEHGLSLSKSLGQHFLADHNILRTIVEACDLRGQEDVLEVGAGIGTLTVALAPASRRLWAVERDARLIPILHDHV